MHGVPVNLNLDFLKGTDLTQICLGQYQIQFRFHPAGSISVEGRWELLDARGQSLDRSYDEPERPPYQLHRLLGKQVASYEVSPPHWFSLCFESGETLRVFDDSLQYESFSIGGLFV